MPLVEYVGARDEISEQGITFRRGEPVEITDAGQVSYFMSKRSFRVALTDDQMNVMLSAPPTVVASQIDTAAREHTSGAVPPARADITPPAAELIESRVPIRTSGVTRDKLPERLREQLLAEDDLD